MSDQKVIRKLPTDSTTFDAQATDQLKALSFEIEDGSPIAILRSVADARKAMIVSVACVPERPDLFALSITVPKGVTFTAFMRRTDLLDAYRLRCGPSCGGEP